jgi:hypothetical protein
MIDYDDFSKEELQAYTELQKKVQLPIMEFEQIADFPPLSLFVNKKKRDAFMEMAWKLWEEGNDLLQKEIPDNFKPYSSLEKQYSAELSAARKYIKESNGNQFEAMKMYSKDNPTIQLDDSDWR